MDKLLVLSFSVKTYAGILPGSDRNVINRQLSFILSQPQSGAAESSRTRPKGVKKGRQNYLPALFSRDTDIATR